MRKVSLMNRRLFLLLTVTALAMRGQCQLVMPPALKAGDTIAVISPSSAPDSMTVAKGCAALREWGYVPVVATFPPASVQSHGQTPEARRSDRTRTALKAESTEG